MYESVPKSKVINPLRENLYSRIQRTTQCSKAQVHITSPHSHHSYRSICSIGTPTHWNRHRYYRIIQRQVVATLRRLAQHRFWNADLSGVSLKVRRDGNHLVRGPDCKRSSIVVKQQDACREQFRSAYGHSYARFVTAFLVGVITTPSLQPGPRTKWFPSLRTFQEIPGSISEPMLRFSKPSWRGSTNLTLNYSIPVSMRWCTDETNTSIIMVTMWRSNMYLCLTTLCSSLDLWIKVFSARTCYLTFWNTLVELIF